MAELGSETEAEHRRAARLADELGIEVVGYQTALYGHAQVSPSTTPSPFCSRWARAMPPS